MYASLALINPVAASELTTISEIFFDDDPSYFSYFHVEFTWASVPVIAQRVIATSSPESFSQHFVIPLTTVDPGVGHVPVEGVGTLEVASGATW